MLVLSFLLVNMGRGKHNPVDWQCYNLECPFDRHMYESAICMSRAYLIANPDCLMWQALPAFLADPLPQVSEPSLVVLHIKKCNKALASVLAFQNQLCNRTASATDGGCATHQLESSDAGIMDSSSIFLSLIDDDERLTCPICSSLFDCPPVSSFFSSYLHVEATRKAAAMLKTLIIYFRSGVSIICCCNCSKSFRRRSMLWGNEVSCSGGHMWVKSGYRTMNY